MQAMKTLALLAVPGIALGLAATATTASAQGTCKVTVDRSQPAGTYSVQRQELENGDCICYVYTGPQPQSDATEQSIASLQSSGACPDAPAVAVPAGATATTGGGGGGALILLGAAAGTAAIVASSSGSNTDSP